MDNGGRLLRVQDRWRYYWFSGNVPPQHGEDSNEMYVQPCSLVLWDHLAFSSVLYCTFLFHFTELTGNAGYEAHPTLFFFAESIKEDILAVQNWEPSLLARWSSFQLHKLRRGFPSSSYRDSPFSNSTWRRLWIFHISLFNSVQKCIGEVSGFSWTSVLALLN